MRATAFFALLVFTASAFNITQYHLGVDRALGFNPTQLQDGQICLNALINDFQTIAELIETQNFDSTIFGLEDRAVQTQHDLKTTCKTYFIHIYQYLTENTNITHLHETIIQNIEQNYPCLIQRLGYWAKAMTEGQDFNAGVYQASIIKILIGLITFKGGQNSSASKITPIPFNRTKFFTEYNAALFHILGINAQVNITGLVECSNYVQDSTLAFLYIKEKLSTLDFEQKLDALQYLIGETLNSVRNCDAAFNIVEAVFGPAERAFSEDPVNFTIEALENFAIAFPNLQGSLQAEIVYIETGEYYFAGQEKAGSIFNIFGSLVNFSSSDPSQVLLSKS